MEIYSRAVAGWAAATHKRTKFALDAVQVALWLHDWAELPAGPQGLVHRSDARSQCTGLSFTTALIEAAGMDSSIGTGGDPRTSVVVPLVGIGLLTYAKVLVAKVEGQGAYIPGRDDEQTRISQGSCIPRVAVFAARRCYPIGCRHGRCG